MLVRCSFSNSTLQTIKEVFLHNKIMSKKDRNITERINALSRELCAGLHEREEVMTVALLAVLAGQSVFLLGPPGTAKSLMARRLSCAFKDSKHFEYLMQKFSTPEEIFGPIDIAELKQGNYKRKTEGYLPTADFAFLDEVWKSNPAILNTLLTITNEKTFRNGDKVEKTPLKALIGASNELPQSGQGLEALWDRFVVRLEVLPMSDRSSFEALLQNSHVESVININAEIAITTAEWLSWQKRDIDSVKLSDETLHVIHVIKVQLAELEQQRKIENRQQEPSYYVSDRRWLRAVMLLKSSAYFSGRAVASLLDALMLRHCLWSSSENIAQIEEIVVASISAGFFPKLNLSATDTYLEETESLLVNNPAAQTWQYFEFSEDDYKDLYKKFKTRIPNKKIYLHPGNIPESFVAFDESGNEIKEFGEIEKLGDNCAQLSASEILYRSNSRHYNFSLMYDGKVKTIKVSGSFGGVESSPLASSDIALLLQHLKTGRLAMAKYEKELADKLEVIMSGSEISLLSKNKTLLETALQKNIHGAKARSLQIKRLIDLAQNLQHTAKPTAPTPTPKSWPFPELK